MSFENIGILNYGAGNFGSVKRAVEALGCKPLEVCTAKDVQRVSRLIFPGVGSAKQAMMKLDELDLTSPLKDFALSGRPLLGICVGMQILGEWSEEGDVACLGLLPFRVTRFRCREPIPHMGWNAVDWNQSHPLFASASRGIGPDANFYFVHSYAAFSQAFEQSSFLLGTTSYGGDRFAGFVADKNIWGAQCHIEKSGKTGLQFLRNFLGGEEG
ncbi:MAG: imidazole glycerol phosphate synthase subunit HisH [Pseudomonadota bacterium]